MLEGKFAPMRIRFLVIDDELKQDTADGHAVVRCSRTWNRASMTISAWSSIVR